MIKLNFCKIRAVSHIYSFARSIKKQNYHPLTYFQFISLGSYNIANLCAQSQYHYQ